jgi:hypothetical protein
LIPLKSLCRIGMSFGLGLILLAASTLAVWLYVRAEKPIDWAIEDRHASLTLTSVGGNCHPRMAAA